MISLLLAAITVAVYWQVLGHQFLSYDDDTYITFNNHVRDGLGARAIAWAFSFDFYAANWHPLTWLSHMLDCGLYGVARPWGHHLTNLILHVFNTILLFLVLDRATRATWRSAFVAALFAVHPLHVESVAWVAERKDLLSTSFWLLAMGAYVSYARRPSVLRYLPVLVALVLGLLAKPMLVTLPFVLLLLDYWPLDRSKIGWRLVLEKLPLFAVAAGASVITLIAQRQGGAVVALDRIPTAARLGNAVVAYAAYIGKMILPLHLAPLYPHAMVVPPAWKLAAALLLLTGVSAWAFRARRTYPYVLMGWSWYLGTLVPVIGLVQVGAQSMADRYTYMTLTGLFIAIAWGIPAALARGTITTKASPARGPASGSSTRDARWLAFPAAAIVAILMGATWRQAARWQDTYSLFSYTVSVTRDNYLAENALGLALQDQGRVDEAIPHFATAVGLRPGYANAHNSLGLALFKNGDNAGAVGQFEEAVRLEPRFAEALHNIGMVRYSEKQTAEAYEYCIRALGIDSTLVQAHNTMGCILWGQGKHAEGLAHWNEAIALRPQFGEPHQNLAIAYHSIGRFPDAWREIQRFQELGGTPDPRLVQELSAKVGGGTR